MQAEHIGAYMQCGLNNVFYLAQFSRQLGE